MISCDIIAGTHQLEEYREIWNRLFDSGEYEASLSFDWTEALIKTHLRADHFFLMVFKQDDEVVGIVPLIVKKINKYGISLATACPISEYYDTHSDLLFKFLSEDLVEVFLKALFSLPCRWDVFRIIRFVETSPLLIQIEPGLQKLSTRYKTRRETPAFYMNLNFTYEDYLRGKSAHFRNNLKRKTKKLNTLGKVSYIMYKDLSSFSLAYENILHIEERSWKQSHGTAISSIKKQLEFYRNLCQNAYDNRWLHLCFLLLNDEPIAYNLGLVRLNKYYYLKTSYHEAFHKVSPSSLLRAWLIETLIKNGIKEVDFTGEPYEWQKHWTDDYRWHKSLVIFNNTFKGRMFSAYHSLKDRRADDMQDTITYYNPRDLKASNDA